MTAHGGIRVDGRRALVVGASRGIGRSIALALAAAGADVAAAARTVGDLDGLASEIGALGRRGYTYELDAADVGQVAAAVDAAAEALGGIDVLVNCAGTTSREKALEITPDEWDRVMALNLRGLFFTCQAAARHMVRQGHGGRIVNISSSLAIGAMAGVAVYGASKGAVSALTRQLAVEWAPHGITVNALAPGWTRTAFTERRFADPEWVAATEKRIPLGRAAGPDEMAGLAVFLASDQSAYVTGQTILADGGLTIDISTRM